MFRDYIKSNVISLLCLMVIIVLDFILLFRGQILASSNLIFILLYIGENYRFYCYRMIKENDKNLFDAMEEFAKAMSDFNKDMGKISKKNDEENNSKGEN